MRAFDASVEQRDNDLRDRFVAAGGFRERVLVAAGSYKAHRFWFAPRCRRRQCPDLVFMKPRFRYKAINQLIVEISLSIRQ